LTDHASIYRMIADVFGNAGLTDAKAGSRLLRHNAASRLLRAAVPLPTISAVLGHASPESTNLYMSEGSEIASDGRKAAGRLASGALEWRSPSVA
jgi:integrase